MAESEEPSSSSWRFSMELLSHVHTLQVFLFNSSSRVKPDQDCLSLKAVLLCAPPALFCSWQTAYQARLYALRLPLPLLLYDYSASLRISALPDCIQLSLPLLVLPPFQLHAFSSLSLAHSGIRADDSGSICAPNLSVQHEANNGVLGENGCSHCGNEDKNRVCNDAHGQATTCTSGSTRDSILKNSAYAATADGCGNDDAHESHEHDDTHAVYGLARPADNNIHGDARQKSELDGAHDLGLVTIPAVIKHGCHHDDCGKEEDQAGHSIHVVSGHGQCEQRPCHKDAIEAPETQEVTEDAATESNFHGCHSCGTRKVRADNPVYGDENRVLVNSDAFKSREHNDANEVQHVAIAASDISACHHHHGISEVEQDVIRAGEDIHKCQHGRNVADHQNNHSSLPDQHHDSMVLDSLIHQGFEDQKSQGATIFHCKKCSVKVSKNPVRHLVQLPCFDWREIAENWFGACCCSFGTEAEILSASFEKSLKLRSGKCLVGSSTFYVNFSDVTVETKSVMLSTDNKIRPLSTLNSLALGNGFMVWENQQSKHFSWLPVYCTCCASLLGAYTCKFTGSELIREGLHLFRCQLTAFNADGSLDDMLRYASFKELLAKELRLRTEENMSYRFLIRSLSSQLPLIQLVVLDYNSLICTGNVTTHILNLEDHPQTTNESTALVGEVGLQQSIKVLFLDCSGLAAKEIRLTERWAQDYDAETIFMLEEFVNVLKGELLSNRVFYPAACGLSQVFHGSFIRMTQK